MIETHCTGRKISGDEISGIKSIVVARFPLPGVLNGARARGGESNMIQQRRTQLAPLPVLSDVQLLYIHTLAVLRARGDHRESNVNVRCS